MRETRDELQRGFTLWCCRNPSQEASVWSEKHISVVYRSSGTDVLRREVCVCVGVKLEICPDLRCETDVTSKTKPKKKKNEFKKIALPGK